MKVGKVLGIVVGGFIALMALVLVSAWLVVDPNSYKSTIAAAVKEATGRELLLQGEIKLSVFPWIALQVGPASLGNPPGFGEQPFVSFKRAAFRARLLPLLAKRLEIGRVEIDGLDARLVKNADGRGNWEGLGKSGDRTATAGASANAADGGQAFAGIAGVKITNSRVSYNQYSIENLNIETGTFAARALVPVTIQFDASRGVATEHARVDARFDFSGDLAAHLYHVAALTFYGTVNRADNPRPVRWNFSTSSLDLDLQAQTLSTPAFMLNLAGAQLSGSLAGTSIIGSPAVSGKVVLAPLVVREFLPRLGLTAPRTRDPKALSLAEASFAYGYGANGATLDNLQITVDDTHLKGSLTVVDLQTQAVKFALAVDAIDLDRYLAPAGASTDAGALTDARTPADAKAPAGTATSGGNARPLEANGLLTVGSIHLAPLDLTAVSVTMAATAGVIHLFPLKAQVDGGQYSGNIVIDGRDSVSVLTLDEQLTGIDVGRLASTGSKGVHVSGRGNVTLQATGRGSDGDALMKTLNGSFEAVVTSGAVEGVDVGFQLARAEALIRRQDLPNLQDTKRTKFDALKMSADITNGVAQTKDLTIASPVLKVTGKGSVNLPTQGLNFALLADTLRTAGDTPIQIPITVTGTAADPTVRPDLEALAKSQLRQKVQDVLQDRLKGLFNR